MMAWLLVGVRNKTKQSKGFFLSRTDMEYGQQEDGKGAHPPAKEVDGNDAEIIRRPERKLIFLNTHFRQLCPSNYLLFFSLQRVNAQTALPLYNN
jgi:hypothetical protein